MDINVVLMYGLALGEIIFSCGAMCDRCDQKQLWLHVQLYHPDNKDLLWRAQVFIKMIKVELMNLESVSKSTTIELQEGSSINR